LANISRSYKENKTAPFHGSRCNNTGDSDQNDTWSELTNTKTELLTRYGSIRYKKILCTVKHW